MNREEGAWNSGREGEKGGKAAVPNLSLLSKAVLLIALRYIVRELFAHICLPCPYQPYTADFMTKDY